MPHKMNPEVKAKWVAALRSGEYPQSKGRLQDAHGFCCYGVLCDILQPDAWEGYNHAGSTGLPSLRIRELAGLDINLPQIVKIKYRYDSLQNHNDAGRTFQEIADAIEEQL